MNKLIGGEKKESGPIILDRLLTGAYSQARSHYWSTRGLLPAAFPPWAFHTELPRCAHIDTDLSADARST